MWKFWTETTQKSPENFPKIGTQVNQKSTSTLKPLQFINQSEKLWTNIGTKIKTMGDTTKSKKQTTTVLGSTRTSQHQGLQDKL